MKLRDIGEAVNFKVYWDGMAVQIDRDAPFTGKTPPREQADQTDYSAAANPKVFTHLNNREVYNAIYSVLALGSMKLPQPHPL